MKIIGLTNKGVTVLCWAIFIIISSAYLFVANAEYKVRVVDLKNSNTNETRRVLHIAGDFDEGISKDIKKALDEYKVDEAVLYSPGGLGYEGFVSANHLSEHEVPVRVAKGTYCISACAVAFIGGTDYKINDSILAFHKGWVPNEPWKNQNEAFDAGQVSGGYSSLFFVANGFSFELPSHINEHSNQDTFIVFHNEKDLNKYYVRTKKNNVNDYLDQLDIKPNVLSSDDIVKYLENNPWVDSGWKIESTLLELTNEDSNEKDN